MNTSTNSTVRRIAALASLLPALAHELTHAIAAAPWAERVTVGVSLEDGDAVCGIDWREGAPAFAKRVAFLAPTLAGTAGAAYGAVYLAEHGLPGSPTGTLLFALAVVGWLVYSFASARDLMEARQMTDDSTTTEAQTDG